MLNKGLALVILILFWAKYLFSSNENRDGEMDTLKLDDLQFNFEANNAKGSGHARGDGIPQDFEKAYHWFRQSGKERHLNSEDQDIVYHMILNEAWEKDLLVDDLYEITDSDTNKVESVNGNSIIIDPEVRKTLAKDPVVRRTVSPKYPIDLRALGVTGKVLTRFKIDKRGNVISPTVVESSNGSFNNSVIYALRQWKFSPAERNGEAVEIEARLLFMFNLGSK